MTLITSGCAPFRTYYGAEMRSLAEMRSPDGRNAGHYSPAARSPYGNGQYDPSSPQSPMHRFGAGAPAAAARPTPALLEPRFGGVEGTPPLAGQMAAGEPGEDGRPLWLQVRRVIHRPRPGWGNRSP